MRCLSLKIKIITLFVLCFGIFHFGIAQNPLLPKKYYNYHNAVQTKENLDTFLTKLHYINFFNNDEIPPIQDKILSGHFKCYLDILAQSNQTKVFYNATRSTDLKSDFLSKISTLTKLEALSEIDSVWLEYFNDTLSHFNFILPSKGYSVCLRNNDIIIKTRIGIPLYKSGQFVNNHYIRLHRKYIVKAINHYLAVINSEKRLGYYSNPLFSSPVENKLQDQDGVGYLLMNKNQVDFYNSFDYWDKFNLFYLFYTKFDDYNFNNIKMSDIEHLENSGLLSLLSEKDKRNLICYMQAYYFKDLKEMLNLTKIITTSFTIKWGKHPEYYSNFIDNLNNYLGNDLQVKILKDGYQTCKADSFDFKIECNSKIYEGIFVCDNNLDRKFLVFIKKVIDENISDKIFYIASFDEVNYFYLTLDEKQRQYILKNNFFYLYGLSNY